MIGMEPAARVVLIGQLTDTHVAAVNADGVPLDEVFVDNNARLVSAISSINAEAPALDVLVGTGDLTNWARPQEYEILAELTAPLTVPFLPLPGNHDDRDLLRSTFPDTPWIDADHASWVTVVGDPAVRIIGLDSTLPGEPGAQFDTDREAWLRSVLVEPHDGVTLLALHHPPFATGVGWMDASSFIGLDRLETVLAQHRVDKVICGHFHRPVSSTIAGIPVEVGMSTVQHVDLDLAPGAGPSLVIDPVGYQIHRVSGSGIRANVVTHTRYIDTPEPLSTARIVPSWAADF
jgi:3',5'-cyclic-AMP phosphodiesterase